LVHWGRPASPTPCRFGFSDGCYLCFSIETRKEVGEGLLGVKGFFKQFELTFVGADEGTWSG
jgi:hypothetical protein